MKYFSLLLLLNSLNVLADDCVSISCDLYKKEKANFEAKIKAINCDAEGMKANKCDQVELAKMTNEFQIYVKNTFDDSSVKSTLKNDREFNSITKQFSKETKVVTGVYDLVPALTDINIGVHWGGIENNAAQVDRVINIDPTVAPKVTSSKWYLTQWKKTVPLMLNNTRADPIIKNSSYLDNYFGAPKYEINSPVGKFGVETSLLIYKDSKNEDSNVFEIVGRNGWLNNVGGSNVFLSTDLIDNVHNNMNNDISLTYNGKISRLNAKYFSNDAQVKNEIVVGQIMASFTALYVPTDGSTPTNLFVQINLADTRSNQGEYRGCYMHGDGAEIVFGSNLDSTFTSQASSSTSALVPYKYNLNKYLCKAITGEFNCPSTIKKPNFQAMSKDLANWKITGFYTGLESQVAKALSSDQEKPGDIKGDVEMGIQYSNLRISSNTQKTYINCDDVFKNADVVSVPTPSLPECTKGSFTNDHGDNVDFSCGCGVVEGGTLQTDGCYHKINNSVNLKKPLIVSLDDFISSPKGDPESNNCAKGVFVNEQGKRVQYFCNCGEIAGANKVGDACYHLLLEN